MRLILVCDDESHILHVVSLKLRNAGFEVMTAEDGAEGLEKARERKPDLLITDYQMPRMNGVELCTALRSEATLQDVPAIMLTARGFRLDPLEVRSARISEVISKPFSPREVLGRVRALLAGTSSAEGSDAISTQQEAA
jgi:two-component system alkaline phosphatase synthesis response regulator PhoP